MQQFVDNRYRLQQPLGSGGMADVFLAHDDVLDRDVALKVMSVRYADDEEFVERFRREAQSAAALSHPNIVSIFDRGESDGGTYYIAMEYLSGGTLKDRIMKRGAFQPRTAAAVALQIAEALRAAHESDVIHRDIKPHNILITDSGDVKVTDFGIARAASSSTMTRTGHILGTAHYISPEQAMGEPVGPASDLYSLGIVLYEMLTGGLPFDADTPLGIAMKHVNGHLVPPQILNPAVPDGINAVTCRLLAKNPEDRYGDDAELIQDLERVVAGLDPAGATTEMATGAMPAAATRNVTRNATRVAPPPPPHSVRRGKKRRRWAPLLLVLLGLLVLIPLAAWAGYNLLGNQQEPNQPVARIAVPDLTGMTLDEAENEYGDDFEISPDGEENGTRPAETILEQDPADGGELERGSEIGVTVASGENEVPDTTGSPRGEAERALEEAGFEASVEREESSAEDEGLVTDQDPSGGASGDPEELDSEVEIIVGTGPDAVTVPAVVGNTTPQAESILARSGLELGAVVEDYSDTVPAGSIISQDPLDGESLEPGDQVDVTVSLGVQQVEVPEVYGATLEDAQASLENVGINSTPVESTLTNEEPAGTALETDPGVGALLDPGSTVTLYYSAGPEVTASPEPTTVTPDASASPNASASPALPEEQDEGDGGPDASAPPAPAPPAPAAGQGDGGDGGTGDRGGPVGGGNRGGGNGVVPENVRENALQNDNVPGNSGGNRGSGGGRGRGGGGED